MHHTEVLGVSVQVTRAWESNSWVVTWYLHRGDQVPTIHGRAEYDADLYDATELEPIVHAHTTSLLRAVSATASLNAR